MAGHSKWANIKHKKAANDSARSNIFSKMSRLITSAVQEGGGIPDPDKNFKLRLAVDRAKAFNMPKDTIQRAIDKASGGEGDLMKSVLYEAFGTGGVAMLISAITDNANRTHSEVKNVIEKNGGKMASQNAVSHMFTQCGVVELDSTLLSEEKAFKFFDAIEGLDFESEEGSYIIYVPFEAIGKVPEVLAEHDCGEAKEIDVYYLPSLPLEIDAKTNEKIDTITEKLEDLDDVQNVYNNIQ